MYTGNYLDNAETIRGVPARKYFGVALEAQLYPDAPTRPPRFAPQEACALAISTFACA